MPVRNATYRDAPEIKMLLSALVLPPSLSQLISQIENMFSSQNHQLYIVEDDKDVYGFAAVHFLPELTFEGCVAHVSHLIMNSSLRTPKLEAIAKHITEQCWTRNCILISLDGNNTNISEAILEDILEYKIFSRIYYKKLMNKPNS